MEPVNETLRMHMCLARSSPVGPAPVTTWMQPLGKPAASKRGATARVPRGAFRGGFDDQDITCGQGGRCLQDEGCDRGVEGVDGCTDSQWFVTDELHKSIVGGEVVALLLVGPASIVQDCVLDVRLLPSWNDRCRVSGRKSVQCQHIDELFVHRSGQAVEALGVLHRSEFAVFFEGDFGVLHGELDVFSATSGNAFHDLAVVLWIDQREGVFRL